MMTTLPDLPELDMDEAGFERAKDALDRALEPSRVDCGWFDAPFGRVFLARSQKGICRVGFRKSEDEFLDGLERRRLLPRMDQTKLDTERRELGDYFEGKLREFRIPVDLRWGTPFQRQVLSAASEIPFGACCCYGDVADRIGRPKAHRAVGNALGSNPVPIVIPCHRVVGAGGKIGGYTGGLDIKRVLMDVESIELEEKS